MKLFTPKQSQEANRKVLEELLRKENAAANALKAKETKLNVLNAEYSAKIEQKQKELREATERLKKVASEEERLIAVLEDRRRSALLPIVNELQELEKEKAVRTSELRQIEDARHEVTQQRQLLQQREAMFIEEQKAFRREKDDVISMLDKRRDEDKGIAEYAVETMELLNKQKEHTKLLLEELQKRQASAENAENIARAAMAVADKKIAEEKREQQKTDDKRKLLKVAMDALRERERRLNEKYGKRKP